MKDIRGRVFTCITVVSRSHVDGRGSVVWVCKCDCGKKTFATTASLTSGNKKSCGHLRREALKKFNKKYLGSDVPVHRVFSGTDIDDALNELEAYL